jgi:ankyrin repeat protein
LSPQAVAVLLSRGVAINAVNEAGDTPLHVAARAELDDMMVLLLAYGADETLKVGQNT